MAIGRTTSRSQKSKVRSQKLERRPRVQKRKSNPQSQTLNSVGVLLRDMKRLRVAAYSVSLRDMKRAACPQNKLRTPNS
jgi:hypothetical protein